MEEQIQILYKVRGLAEEKERLTARINQLDRQFKNVHNMAEDKERKKIRPGFAGYLIVFILLDYLAGRQAGEYLLHTDATVIALVLGIPFALSALLLIRVMVLSVNKLMARKDAADHERNEETNKRILKENDDITSENIDILMKITECNERLEEISNTLEELAPWFPECYFQPKAVDFAISQMETRHASNVNQAFVYYEAYGKR